MADSGFDRHEDHVIVPVRRKIAYGAGGFADTLINDVINGWLLLFYTTIVPIKPRLVGLALAIPRLWDAITDPMMGLFSDNFRSKWGRRRPFILIFGPLCCFSFWLLWTCPDEYSERGRFIYLLTVCIVFYTFHTIAMVPYGALGAELSTDYNERTKIFAMRGYWTRVAAFIIVPIWQVSHWSSFGSVQRGFATITLILSCFGALGFVWVVLGTQEEAELQKQPKMKMLPAFKHAFSNRQYMLFCGMIVLLIVGIFSAFPFANYINIYYVYGGDKAAAGPVMTIGGYITQVLTFVFMVVFTRLGVRIGKRNALIVSLVMLAIAPISSWFVFTPKYPWLQLVFGALLAPAVPGIVIFPNAMVADLVDLDELKTNRRREGIYMAVMGFMIKLGFTGSTMWTAQCLEWVGFDINAESQSDETIFKLRVFLAVIPLVAVGISALMLCFYRVNEKEVRETRIILEQRRQERLQAGADAD